MKTLNIKDPEVHRLAAAISEETGESMTRVVLRALQQQWSQLAPRGRKASTAELQAIVRRAGAIPGRKYKDHAALLYDRHGVPK